MTILTRSNIIEDVACPIESTGTHKKPSESKHSQENNVRDSNKQNDGKEGQSSKARETKRHRSEDLDVNQDEYDYNDGFLANDDFDNASELESDDYDNGALNEDAVMNTRQERVRPVKYKFANDHLPTDDPTDPSSIALTRAKTRI
jgi:hypothetical protein